MTDDQEKLLRLLLAKVEALAIKVDQLHEWILQNPEHERGEWWLSLDNDVESQGNPF